MLITSIFLTHFTHAQCDELFEGKTTTIGIDSARNMVAAIRLTRYEHMNCVAHMVQRSVTVSLADSGFVNARKVVCHFKHSPANAAELQAQQVSLGKKQEPLIQDVPTRWNSTLEMVKRLRSNKEAVKEEAVGHCKDKYYGCVIVISQVKAVLL